jgi:import receptor subunit TOM70
VSGHCSVCRSVHSNQCFCLWLFLVDPDCDIAVATMAQLLLQQGKVTRALEYFERAASLSRTEAEIVNALSYAEATRTQLQVSLSFFILFF